VATDKMARGIDVRTISLVVNYDAPKHGTTYVHRVGRTARANKSGKAITLVKRGQVLDARASYRFNPSCMRCS
jgi:superfamily II DNA/RNA helicase